MNLLMIDDRGELLTGDVVRRRMSFAAVHSTDEFSAYVVKNMGFIALDLYGRSCQIRCRPSILSQPSLERLAAWLASAPADRFALCHFDASWNYELLRTSDLALHRLVQLGNAAQLMRPEPYLACPVALDRMADKHPLISLIRAWPELSQSVHADGLRNMLRQTLHDRYVMVCSEPGSAHLRISDIGRGFMAYNAEWLAKARGRPVDDQPDKRYGQWVLRAYREALAANRPAVFDIDAIIEETKEGRARVRYKRVVLPVREANGRSWLLSGSIIDEGIDLRLQPIGKTA